LTVAVNPPHTDGLRVEGVLRWYTVTAETVGVAIEEEPDSEAVEWHFPRAARVQVYREPEGGEPR
jgi:hypothetical protein